MKTRRWKDVVIGVFFIILTVVCFRKYFFSRQVPLPFNLLVSYYAPWKFEAWEGYPSGVPNKPLGFDNIKLFYPFRRFTIDTFKSGKWPLWNPYVFSGNVHIASYQAAVFHPMSFIYFLLPLADSWSFMVIIQPILCAWFLYLFLRSLSVSHSSSVFGAVCFAFSGWMISMWQEVLVQIHSLMWLPLGLYASNILWKKKQNVLGVFILTLALSFSVLSGFLQMSIYVYATIILWNLYLWLKDEKHSRTPLYSVGGAILLSALLTAIHWVPGFEAYLASPRGRVNAAFLFEQFLSPIYFLLTYIVPDFWGSPGTYNYFSPTRYIQERTIFIGLFGFLFGYYAVLKKLPHPFGFWKIYTLVTLSLGLALPTSWIWHTLNIPILSVAMPARIFALSTLGLSILAAWGLDSFIREKSWRTIKIPIFAATAVVAVLWVFVMIMRYVSSQYEPIMTMCTEHSSSVLGYVCPLLGGFDQKTVTLYATVSLRNLFLPTFFLLSAWFSLIVFRTRRRLLIITVIGVTVIGSVYFASKMLYFSDRTFEYPETIPIKKLKELSGLYRVWTYGDAYVFRNILSHFYIYSPEGYDALFSHSYGELLHAIRTDGVITGDTYRTDANLSEMGQSELMSSNPYRLREMSIIGVKYMLEVKTTGPNDVPADIRFPPESFSVAWEDDLWRIWEYRDVFPRAFAAHSYIVASEKDEASKYLFDPEVDLRKTVILDREPLKAVTGDPSSGPSNVEIITYESDRVTLQAEMAEDGLVFLSDTYFPGWNVYVDGQKDMLYKANYAFRAVIVPKGLHSVEFIYEPASFRLGVLLTVSGMCLTVGFVLLRRRYPV